MEATKEPDAATIEGQLRSVLVGELERRGLAEPETLAGELGLAVGVARSLLRSQRWTSEQAERVAQRLGLHLDVRLAGTKPA